MNSLAPNDRRVESSSSITSTQISLATIRWSLITAVSIGVWIGSSAMAVSAAHYLLDLSAVLAWMGSGAATLPVALSTFSSLDRLIQAPQPANSY